MNLAPVVLFVYNRPKHTEETLVALSENDLAKDSVLYIYADGAKENASEETLNNIAETRRVIKKKQWCAEVNIIESPKNKGLANSIIEGVTNIVNKYGKIIVLEDDLITSKGFLKYMNDGLVKYKEDEKVMQISGFCFPAVGISKNHSSFFIPLTASWGWGTWNRAWRSFDAEATGYERLEQDKDLERKFNLDNICQYSQMLFNQMESKGVDSWAIRWWWTVFKMQGIVLYPDQSLIKNDGYGDEGTHTKGKNPFASEGFDRNYYVSYFPLKAIINSENFGLVKDCIRNSTNRGHQHERENNLNKLKRRFIQLFNK